MCIRDRDIAGGTGDLAKAFAKRAGPTGEVWLTDINDSMLRVGRDRLADAGLLVPTAVCDAERLPFPTGYFDRVSVAFGLRNMTHKDRALAEMTRVLKMCIRDSIWSAISRVDSPCICAWMKAMRALSGRRPSHSPTSSRVSMTSAWCSGDGA